MNQQIRIHQAVANTGVMDFSWLLDAPAGKHGFAEIRDGHMYFADGTRARFLGFNMATRSSVPTHEAAEKLAERFASMGVNIIRLHAADAPISDEPLSWACPRKSPLLDYESGSTRTFNKEGLDRFDYFFAKLKEKGIYLHIDLLVARRFLDGDGLDYPGGFPETVKCFPMINDRLTELQMEYARELLTHVNPYTGLAIVDDPAVVTVQINNEESAIKGTMEVASHPELVPYHDEVQRKFNHFLLMKYDNRENLAKAWTADQYKEDGSVEKVCALGEDEDPVKGTVGISEGGFYQPVNEPMGDWKGANGMVSPARYADYMEFGLANNRRFYLKFKQYLKSLGVKVPIAASNLVAGAADVYGHAEGDVMENNSYFNHPIPPFGSTELLAAGPMEYVSVNPLTMQTGVGAVATTITGLASVAVVSGKPFIITEWNEYGLHPFHSTAFVQTIAYACLNDWDGLILYNYQTSENWDDQPGDEIHSVFDAFNDPALISQWGFMAAMFLKGTVSIAKGSADAVYTMEDVLSLPVFHEMPNMFFPYITSYRNIFLEGTDTYTGKADVALNAGFFNGADLSCAEHGIWYSWSPYRDPFRRFPEGRRLKAAAEGADKELSPGVHLGKGDLVFDDIRSVAGSGDYRKFAEYATKAMQEWGVLPEGTGYVDGALVSDTGEIRFDPDHSRFSIQSKEAGYFSGAPEEEIRLSDDISVKAENERISISLMEKNGTELTGAKEYILTAVGGTGLDQTTREPGPSMMGFPLTQVKLKGKLFAETLEGSISVKAKEAELKVLSPIGEELETIKGIYDPKSDWVTFNLNETKGILFHLTVTER